MQDSEANLHFPLLGNCLIWLLCLYAVSARAAETPWSSQRAPLPEFSVRRGTFEKAFTLSLTTGLEGASIRYTSDGSDPLSPAGKVYVSPIQITNTTVIRAASFKQGFTSSTVQTHSYIFLDQIIHQPKNPPGFPVHWGFNPGFPGRRVPSAYAVNLDPLRVNPSNASSPIDPAKMERYRAGLRELPLVSIGMKTEDMFGASVYDFTEQPTASFARNYFGGGKTDFEIVDQGVVKSGDRSAFDKMMRLSNLEKPANYEAMQHLLNIPEFIDYTLLHFFVGHQDWGYDKNWYAIRKRVTGPDGTFSYIPWDGENHLLDEYIDRVSNPNVPSDLHTKLMRNAEYRRTFAEHVFKHMVAPDGVLTPAKNIARWQKWQAIVDKPIVAESVRWGNYRRDIHQFADGQYQLYTRENHWLRENERITKSYLVKRNAIVLRQLRRAGLYAGPNTP